MIAKSAGGCTSAAGAIAYIMREAESDRSGIISNIDHMPGLIASVIAAEWRHWQRASRSRSKYQAIHHIISWREDESVDPSRALALGEEYAARQFGDRRHVVAVHRDGHQIHAHVVAEWVDSRGKGYVQRNEHLRAMRTCADIAAVHGLIVVSPRRQSNEHIRQHRIPSALSQQIRSAIDRAVEQSDGDIERCILMLSASGVEVSLCRHRRTGQTYGIIYRVAGSPPISGSALGDGYAYRPLIRRLARERRRVRSMPVAQRRERAIGALRMLPSGVAVSDRLEHIRHNYDLSVADMAIITHAVEDEAMERQQRRACPILPRWERDNTEPDMVGPDF